MPGIIPPSVWSWHCLHHQNKPLSPSGPFACETRRCCIVPGERRCCEWSRLYLLELGEAEVERLLTRRLEQHLDGSGTFLGRHTQDGAIAEEPVHHAVARRELSGWLFDGRLRLGRGFVVRRLWMLGEAGTLQRRAGNEARGGGWGWGRRGAATAVARAAPQAAATTATARRAGCHGAGLALGALVRDGEQRQGNLFDEARGLLVDAVAAVEGAAEGACQVEAAHGAGDADVGQAALLLQLVLTLQRARMGQHALLQPGDEDDGEL